jgi:hypothetical protein
LHGCKKLSASVLGAHGASEAVTQLRVEVTRTYGYTSAELLRLLNIPVIDRAVVEQFGESVEFNGAACDQSQIVRGKPNCRRSAETPRTDCTNGLLFEAVTIRYRFGG